MYQASVPVFLRGYTNLSDILSKAAAYATAKKIDPTVLISARLYPDMFPLSKQVQIASDIVKGGIARLAGVEVPSYADTETSFAELQTRLSKTADFLKTFKPEQIDGSETKNITLKVGGNEMSFAGQSYLLDFVIPNFFFHSSTVYAILRHNGLEIGKKDFLGSY
jgi:hypothetical protein